LSFCFGSFLYFFDFFGRSTCCLITLTGAGGVGRLVVVALVVGTFVAVAVTSLPLCDGDQDADEDELKLSL